MPCLRFGQGIDAGKDKLVQRETVLYCEHILNQGPKERIDQRPAVTCSEKAGGTPLLRNSNASFSHLTLGIT